MRIPSIVLIAAVAICAPLRGQEPLHPPSMTPSGSAPINLVSQAQRTHLLGLVDLYSIALYAGGTTERAMVSSETAKALRIAITYEPDLRRTLSLDWRPELIPPLEPAARTQLRGALAPLVRGDVVIVEYAPGKGTSIRINKTVVVSGISHDLMVAFLDHWIGQRPVSEDIRQQLLARHP